MNLSSYRINILLLIFVLCPVLSYAVVVPGEQLIDIEFIDTPLTEVASFVSIYSDKSFILKANPQNISWNQKAVNKTNLIQSFSELLAIYNLSLHYSKNGYYLVTSDLNVSNLTNNFFIYHLQYVSSKNIAEAVQLVFGQSLIIQTIEDSPVIIASGSPEHLKMFSKTISSIDRPQPDIKLFHIENISISSANKHLQDLGIYKDSCALNFWSKEIVCRGTQQQHISASLAFKRLDKISASKKEEIVYLHTVASDQVVPILNSHDLQIKIKPLSPTSIYLYGNSVDIQKAQKTVALLDGQSTQIRIEAVIASLNDSAFKDLGVQLKQSGSDGSLALGALAFQDAATFNPSFLLNFLQGETGLKVSASKGDYKGELLSSPSLTVLNGKKALIHVGQNIPFVTSTTENASGSRTTSIERQDIGVKLSITPKIEGDFVNLNINQEVSSVSPDSKGAADIITEIQKIQSSVLLADGETIFLGGVRSQIDIDQQSSVPLLGDIPYLGSVFRYTNKQNENRNLIISLKTQILRREI